MTEQEIVERPRALSSPEEMMVSVLDPIELKQQLVVEQERRQLLQRFIHKNLMEGVDYGRIHVASKDKCPNPRECRNEYHLSKPCLFKPGAEKFCSLLQLCAEFTADKETLDMMGGASGLVAFRCRLNHIPTNRTLAEGRGTCALSEKGGMANTTVKIAEKRALVDAVLRLGLSDSFTQDLEDMKELPAAILETQATAAAPLRASQQELNRIKFYAMAKRVDVKKIDAFTRKHYATSFEDITSAQASRVMNMLEKKYGNGGEVERVEKSPVTVTVNE